MYDIIVFFMLLFLVRCGANLVFMYDEHDVESKYKHIHVCVMCVSATHWDSVVCFPVSWFSCVYVYYW